MQRKSLSVIKYYLSCYRAVSTISLLCCALLCHAMLCHAMPCPMPRHATPCDTVPGPKSRPNPDYAYSPPVPTVLQPATKSNSRPNDCSRRTRTPRPCTTRRLASAPGPPHKFERNDIRPFGAREARATRRAVDALAFLLVGGNQPVH